MSRERFYEAVHKTQGQHVISVEVYYSLGGTNWFHGGTSPRGYYLSATPEIRGEGTRSFSTGNPGTKMCVVPCQRQSPKRAAEAVVLGKAKEMGLVAHVLKENGMRLEGQLAEDSTIMDGGMRFIFIDARFKEVIQVWKKPEETTLAFMQRKAAPFSGLIDLVRIGKKDDMFVDDEGLLHNPKAFFLYDGYPSPLSTCGLITGTDGEGETIATDLDINSVRAKMKFIDRYQALEISKKLDASRV